MSFDDQMDASPSESSIPRSGSSPFLYPNRLPQVTPSPEPVSRDFSRSSPRRGSSPLSHGYPNHCSSLGTVEEVPSPEDDKGDARAAVRDMVSPPQTRTSRPSFSFNMLAPICAGDALISPDRAPSPLYSRGGKSISKNRTPCSTQPDQLAPNSVSRLPSASSQLRNEVNSDELVEEAGPPPLAPSVSSDSASSDGHALESPEVTSLPTALEHHDISLRPTDEVNEKPLPLLPFLPVTQTSPCTGDPIWLPGDHLRVNQVALTQKSVSTGPSQLPLIIPLSPLSPEPASSPSSRPSTPSSSTHSILPGVAARLAQLESREEALRKFSVASAVSGQDNRQLSVVSATSSREVDNRKVSLATAAGSQLEVQNASIESAASVQSAYSQAASAPAPPVSASPHQIKKRRSYTTALAPKPARSQSDDVLDGSAESASGVGHTTFVTKRSYADPWSLSPDPFCQTGQVVSYTNSLGGGAPGLGLSRNMSTSSISTTATSIEKALISRPGGPRSPAARPPNVTGSHSSAREMGDMGPQGGTYVRSGYVYGYEVEGSSASRISLARRYASPRREWKMPRGSVGGETDESEGLL
jgi:hypothetical protein